MAPNLYIIESPLQLIHCVEAASIENNSDRKAVLVQKVSHNQKQRKQTTSVLSLKDWDNTITFKGRRWYTGLSVLYILVKLRWHYGHYHNVYIGDIRSRWMLLLSGSIKRDRVYMVDDGDGTPERQSADIAPCIHGDSQTRSEYSRVQKCVLHIFRAKYLSLSEINLFTVFSIEGLPGQDVIMHRYDYLRTKYGQYNIDRSEIAILGSNLINAGLLSRQEYRNSINRLVRKYSEHEKVVYYAHRWEDDADLDVYKSYGVTVVTPDMPLEILFLFSQKLPGQIWSFPSFARTSLSLLFGHMDVKVAELPLE